VTRVGRGHRLFGQLEQRVGVVHRPLAAGLIAQKLRGPVEGDLCRLKLNFGRFHLPFCFDLRRG
jgi:hypothetical protein